MSESPPQPRFQVTPPPSSIMMSLLGSTSICDITTAGGFYWLLLSFGFWWRWCRARLGCSSFVFTGLLFCILTVDLGVLLLHQLFQLFLERRNEQSRALTQLRHWDMEPKVVPTRKATRQTAQAFSVCLFFVLYCDTPSIRKTATSRQSKKGYLDTRMFLLLKNKQIK